MKQKKKKEPTPKDLLKLELAEEIGLKEKVLQQGWGGLTAAETGRIGGLLGAKQKNKAGGQGNDAI